jgi:hypothetical protein
MGLLVCSKLSPNSIAPTQKKDASARKASADDKPEDRAIKTSTAPRYGNAEIEA